MTVVRESQAFTFGATSLRVGVMATSLADAKNAADVVDLPGQSAINSVGA